MGLKAYKLQIKKPHLWGAITSTGIYARVGQANNEPIQKTYPQKDGKSGGVGEWESGYWRSIWR